MKAWLFIAALALVAFTAAATWRNPAIDRSEADKVIYGRP